MRQINTRQVILLLFFIAFCLKLYYLDKNPLQFDDTLYAEMIAEEAENPTFLPKYLGMWAPWKPGTYFITYSLFLPITSQLFDSIDWIYKFPNIIFGVLNAFIFYFIAKRFSNKDVALVASLLFYASYGVFYTESRLLMEAFSLTPILLSLFFYTNKNMDPSTRFIGAGVFALVACLTKIVISFMIIPLAVAYALKHDRKNLSNPLFLSSLLAPFLGMLMFYLALDSIGLAEGVLLEDTGKFFFIFDYLDKLPENFLLAALYFFVMFAIYLVISIRKMFSSWEKYLFFSVWMLASMVPLFSGEPHPWYFYYVAPAVAFFTSISLTQKGKIDSFSILVILILFISNIAFVALGGLINSSALFEAKEIGLSMAGKENVLIIGNYPPNTVVIAYKILTERKETGTYLDFGNVILGTKNESENSIDSWIAPFNDVVEDYNTNAYQFEEEDFASVFRTKKFMRKKTNITEFDYIVVSPSSLPLYDSRYELYQNSTEIAIYKRSEKT